MILDCPTRGVDVGVKAAMYDLIYRMKLKGKAIYSSDLMVILRNNEKANTAICYLLAGALMAAAGVISLSILGNMSPKLGLGSSAYMMNAFLPMFIGGFLAKYSDRNIGIMIGSFVQACIISGFAILGLSTSLQSVLNAVIVLTFLVFTSNSYKIAEFQMMKEKRLKAQMALENAG